MIWRTWKENWRWWHGVGLGMICLPQVAAPLLYWLVVLPTINNARVNPRSDILDRVELLTNIVLFLSLVMAVLGLLWFALAVPWFEAGDERFNERITPAFRKKMIRSAAWMPFVLAVGMVILLLADAVTNWFWSNVWEPSDLLSMWLALPILAFAVFGWRYDRVLQRRLRRTAERARVCFECAYSLAEIPNCTRCPECGHAVG